MRFALCSVSIVLACASTPVDAPPVSGAPGSAPPVESASLEVAVRTLPPLVRAVGGRVPEPTPDTLSKGPCGLGEPVVLGTAAHVRTAVAAFRDNGGLAAWYDDAAASILRVQPVTLDGAPESPSTTIELGRSSGVAKSLLATESGYLLLLIVPNAGSKKPGPDAAHLELIALDHRGEVVGVFDDVASARWSGTAALGWYDTSPVLFSDELVGAVDVGTGTVHERMYVEWTTVASGPFVPGDGRVYVMLAEQHDDEHRRRGWLLHRALEGEIWHDSPFVPDPADNYLLEVDRGDYVELRLDMPVPEPELSWNGEHHFVSLGRIRDQRGELFLQPLRCGPAQ